LKVKPSDVDGAPAVVVVVTLMTFSVARSDAAPANKSVARKADCDSSDGIDLAAVVPLPPFSILRHSVLAGFARADVNALAIMHFDFDGLVTAVAPEIEAHIVPRFISSRTVS